MAARELDLVAQAGAEDEPQTTVDLGVHVLTTPLQDASATLCKHDRQGFRCSLSGPVAVEIHDPTALRHVHPSCCSQPGADRTATSSGRRCFPCDKVAGWIALVVDPGMGDTLTGADLDGWVSQEGVRWRRLRTGATGGRSGRRVLVAAEPSRRFASRVERS